MNTDTSTSNQQDSLKAFLQDEIREIKTRLDALKGKLHADDFQSLEADLKERSETLEGLTDDDDTQLFILRRELGTLKENMEALAVRQSLWSRSPFSVKVAIFVVPVILYFVWLSFVQWRNQGQIYDYPATQTAVAAQTVLPSPTVAATPTPTQLP
jgi:hypothetical protein